jgi:biopolymer transport protein ExbD
MRIGEPAKMTSAINVTPLVDVVLVLLIIFMVMAPHMRQGPGPQIDLPETAKPKEQGSPARILVTLDERGVLWIEDQKIDPERFGDDLRAAAAKQKEPKVVVNAAGDADFKKVVAVLDEARKIGITKVGISTEKK